MMHRTIQGRMHKAGAKEVSRRGVRGRPRHDAQTRATQGVATWLPAGDAKSAAPGTLTAYPLTETGQRRLVPGFTDNGVHFRGSQSGLRRNGRRFVF
jgi:hypothetical protein